MEFSSSQVFLSVFVLASSYAFITYIEVRYPLEGTRSPPGAPWPQPQVFESTSDIYTLDEDSFSFTANIPNCDIVSQAFDRYRNIIFLDQDGKSEPGNKKITKLSVTVKSEECEKYPYHDADESYKLEVEEPTSTLEAETVWGFLRGMETFSQLIFFSDETDKYYQINASSIEDWPRFKYRGIMLDTARHFEPMSKLRTNLDAMSYNKFNVFHWHIVDDQSFPYESVTFPELSEKGAYTQKHVYTQEKVAEIIEYARVRGIRVIPEFDTPGHTVSWGLSHLELITPCYGDGENPGTANYTWHAAYEILNPILNTTYDFLEDLFTEVKQKFPDDYMHLGMDEAYPYCWMSNPDITEFMEQNNIEDYGKLQEYYVERVLEIMKKLNAKYIIWQDPIDDGAQAAPDTVVEVWKNLTDVPSVAQHGYQMILSACWYLNYISYGQDWKNYYECDPLNWNGTEEEKKLMIGGEACLWHEYIDGTNMLPLLWPRASAVAERLWSDITVNNTDDAMWRLDEHRCRMLKRGIPAKPILNGFCGDYEEGWEEETIVTPKPCNGYRISISYLLALLTIVLFFVTFQRG